MAGEITYESMTQRQKVAALLIALGPGTASEILKNIKELWPKPHILHKIQHKVDHELKYKI